MGCGAGQVWLATCVVSTGKYRGNCLAMFARAEVVGHVVHT